MNNFNKLWKYILLNENQLSLVFILLKNVNLTNDVKWNKNKNKMATLI